MTWRRSKALCWGNSRRWSGNRDDGMSAAAVEESRPTHAVKAICGHLKNIGPSDATSSSGQLPKDLYAFNVDSEWATRVPKSARRPALDVAATNARMKSSNAKMAEAPSSSVDEKRAKSPSAT